MRAYTPSADFVAVGYGVLTLNVDKECVCLQVQCVTAAADLFPVIYSLFVAVR